MLVGAVGVTDLRVRELRALQGGHVAAETVLFDVQLLEVLIPLGDLFVYGLLAARVCHHAQLQPSHLLHFDVLKAMSQCKL